MQDFLPTLRTLCGGGEETFFAAGRGQRDDFRDAEFGGFLDGPFERVEFYDGE